MPILVGFFPSTRQNKRYTMYIKNPDKRIDFGLKNGTTYIDEGDKKKRQNYLSRHKPREDWNNLNAGSASARILWGDSTDIKKNLKDYIKFFNLEVPDGTKMIL